MFSLLFALSTSANFCYKQDGTFPACPEGAIEITTIEEIVEKKSTPVTPPLKHHTVFDSPTINERRRQIIDTPTGSISSPN